MREVWSQGFQTCCSASLIALKKEDQWNMDASALIAGIVQFWALTQLPEHELPYFKPALYSIMSTHVLGKYKY